MATESRGIRDGQLITYVAEACPLCGRDPEIGNIGVAIYLSGSYVVGCYGATHEPVTFSGDIGEELGVTVQEWNDWVSRIEQVREIILLLRLMAFFKMREWEFETGERDR